MKKIHGNPSLECTGLDPAAGNEGDPDHADLINAHSLAILDSVPNGILVLEDEKILFANKGIRDIFDWDTSEVLGRLASLFHASDGSFDEVRKAIRGASGEAPGSCVQVQCVSRDGTALLCKASARPIANGFVLLSYVDITEYEQALRKNEEEYRLHFTSVSDVILILDRNYTILSISPSIERLLGYTSEQIVGRSLLECNIIPPECMDQAYSDFQTLLSGKRTYSTVYEVRTKDGERKYGEISGSPIIREGSVVSVLCIGRDVTERVEARNALIESEKRYRDIFDNVSDFLYFHDLEGNLNVDQTNRIGKVMWMHAKGQGLMRNIKDILPAMYQSMFDEYLVRIKREGRDEGLVTILDDRGRKRVLEYRNSLVYKGITPIGVRGSARDITDRIRVEVELRKSEEKYRTILKDIEEGYYEVDLKGRLLFFNDAMCTMLGYRPEEVKGLSSRSYTDKANAKRILAVFGQVFKTGRPDKGSGWEFIRKDGKRIHVEASVSLIRDNDGNPTGFRGICRDITRRVQEEEEKKKLEYRLQQAKKMEAIGTLAGGVAHDLNNILSGLVSYPELILMDLSPEDPLRKPIQTIQHSGEKAAAIVQDLLTLARRGASSTEVTHLRDVIMEYLKSPEFLKLKSDYPLVHVGAYCEPDLFSIVGTRFQLGKVIMNLITNAAEAIRDRGVVTITAANVYLDTPLKGYGNIVEGEYVAVTVSDTGVGISEEDRERIFEPFYTRKVMGRSGTGLGMTVVWGTVQDHHGYIEIRSTQGVGTTITVYLPATREAAKDQPHHKPLDYPGNGETIFVVDDVELQREVASKILTRLGYQVKVFQSGEEVVEYMKGHCADLVILDMIMDPGMNGLETYRKIIELHPRQKALIASGYSETEQVRELKRLGAGKYIKKPYLIETLGRAIRDELNK